MFICKDDEDMFIFVISKIGGGAGLLSASDS